MASGAHRQQPDKRGIRVGRHVCLLPAACGDELYEAAAPHAKVRRARGTEHSFHAFRRERLIFDGIGPVLRFV
jgi:hypothetical protein